ncbi:hypothetical protein SAMN04487904_102194 [Actinopolyspora lacussalsi subsp. righensis]|uniref:Uncharacterized protein n=1 Tax=Actinopolyspora righensis TaxID=995060 RepID=A0A1I6Y471_9ACTN|nr:DUF6247 family protein [Actinopolyspora righensis]SFT45320.1 hypothetical protein SAMN04487904_102194 [Actinopolyspora righensis]
MVDSSDWKIRGNVHRDAKVFREVLEGEDRTAFEREFRGALWEVAQDFDTSHIDEVLLRWWGSAVNAAQPITDEERDAIERAERGDFSKVWQQDTDGTFWQRDESGVLWRRDEHGVHRETDSGLRMDG